MIATKRKTVTGEGRAFALALHQTAALWRILLDQHLRPFGFSQASWRTMIALRNHGGEPCRQTELAQRLGIEAPSLVRLLDRMEKQGWVLRLPDPADRRSKRVALTAESLALAPRMEAEVERVRDEFLAGEDAEAVAQALALLLRLGERGRVLLAETPATSRSGMDHAA